MGRGLGARLRDLWVAIEEVFRERLEPVRGDLAHCVADLEAALRTDALQVEILARARAARTRAVRWVGFRPDRAEAFERLNLEWLEQHFEVEPTDRALLGDPQRSVIDPGGDVVFAELHGELVGTCALRPCGDGVFELSKMAVTAPCRGLGLGRGLLRAVVRRFEALGGTRLFLESSTKLAPALALYESEGFRHAPPHEPSPYSRCNVYMVFDASARPDPR